MMRTMAFNHRLMARGRFPGGVGLLQNAKITLLMRVPCPGLKSALLGASLLWGSAAMAAPPAPVSGGSAGGAPVAQVQGAVPAAVSDIPSVVPARDGVVHVSGGPGGQIVFDLGGLAAPEIVLQQRGADVRFKGKVTVDLTALRKLSAVAWASSRVDHGNTVINIRAQKGALNGMPQDGKLILGGGDFAKKAAQNAKAAEKPAAKTSSKSGGSVADNKDKGRGDVPSAEDLDKLRKDVAGKLAALNSSTGLVPGGVGRGAVQVQPTGQNGAPANGAQGNAVFGNVMVSGPEGGAAKPVASGPPKQPCAAMPLALWKGMLSFVGTDAALRARVARAPEDLQEVAGLAEFYVAHGLSNEAIALLDGWAGDLVELDADAAVQARFKTVRDIAHLMHGDAVDNASPLFAEDESCERPERSVWLALSAAATGDTSGVVTNARRARASLSEMPEPMRTIFASHIADASGEDPEVLRAMVAATRTSAGGEPEDIARRWYLQARVARAAHNATDEQLFLEHAVATGNNAAALFARAHLDGLQMRRSGAVGVHAEKDLMDLARTYRHDSLGQEAALMLARRRLEDGHFADALDLADMAARAGGRSSDGQAAHFVAQVLRTLLVDARGVQIPPVDDRIALFWRYEGYATPGENGDDIRQGAAKLLLAQGFADSALDVARQLAPVTLAQPAGTLIRAQAEAQAPTGDPHMALAILQKLPPSNDGSRVAAMALARMGQTKEAISLLAKVNTPEARAQRAALLYDTGAWPEAAAAYAEILQDSNLSQEQRVDITRRYSLAASLAQSMPKNAPPADMLSADQISRRLLDVTTPTAQQQMNEPPVASVRDALGRAKQIETLLNP